MSRKAGTMHSASQEASSSTLAMELAKACFLERWFMDLKRAVGLRFWTTFTSKVYGWSKCTTITSVLWETKITTTSLEFKRSTHPTSKLSKVTYCRMIGARQISFLPTARVSQKTWWTNWAEQRRNARLAPGSWRWQRDCHQLMHPWSRKKETWEIGTAWSASSWRCHGAWRLSMCTGK